MLRIEIIQQELGTLEVKRKVELDEEQKGNPYEVVLTQGVEVEESKWYYANGIMVNIQQYSEIYTYNQHPLGHYELEVKVPEGRNGINMYKITGW